MAKFLLDTNAVSDCIHGRRGVGERVLEARLAGHVVGTSVAVLCELMAGIEASQSRDRNMILFERRRSMFRIWPFWFETAREFARLHAELKSIGRPMQLVDIMVAATAMTLSNCTVVTCDSDLFAVPGLMVENWAK